MAMLLASPEAVLVSKCMDEFDEMIARLKRQRQAAQEAVESFSAAIEHIEKARNSITPQIFEKLVSASQSIDVENKSREATERSDALSSQIMTYRVRGLLTPTQIANAAKSVLLETGRPLKRGDLVNEMRKRGIPLAGMDKNKNLGTILWRHPELFVRVNNLGYWVKGVAIPGIYEPADE